MSKCTITDHAEARMRQRGFRNADVAMMVRSATEMADDAYVMTDADVSREITRRKAEIAQLERLRGAKIVLDGDMVVTMYHPRPKARRWELRRGRESA